MPETNRFERVPVRVFPAAAAASAAVAAEIGALIRARAAEGRSCVLGLATGSTPMTVYADLVRLHRDGLSFSNVVTFNLDEYYPMPPDALQSYRRFMREHLFDHVDVDPANIHIPDGTLPAEAVADHARAYEAAIEAAGGIDLQLLGIGRTGHIGFNEPGSGADSRTRLITLDRLTRLDAASDFFGLEYVPRRAVTMGVGTILEARRVVLLSFGEHKAPVLAEAIEGEVSPRIAASWLQRHPGAEVVLDAAAAAALTRSRAPWLVRSVTWEAAMVRKAVVWLAQRAAKPILSLTDEDYNEAGLQELLAGRGSAYDINLDVFRGLGDTITGWPGGKPAGQRRPGDRPRAADTVFPKRVVIFSPHPDDDVISMGGTLSRMVAQGHEVHVAYQTSGNLAVFDADAVRFADFAVEFNQLFGLGAEEAERLEARIRAALGGKEPGTVDAPEVRGLKALIRRSETRAAGRECGLPDERLHFLDLPFYETGTVRKAAIGAEDVARIVTLLDAVRPHQIYAAGDLTDPHGTHRQCLEALERAFAGLAGEEWFRDAEVWLYRGAWQEWEPDVIEMAVPLSPDEVVRKRGAIFRHQSQKDRAMFPGTDEREFWQRAEARNRGTAKLYDALGLAEYAAVEAFVRWRP